MVEMLRHQFVPFGDGTLSCQLADARENGIDRCVMCPIATKPSQADVILRTALEIRDGARGEAKSGYIVFAASELKGVGAVRFAVRPLECFGHKGPEIYSDMFAL